MNASALSKPNQVRVLSMEAVSKAFFDVPVLKNVSLQLVAGQVLGLVGENGAGKSTLMNILGGVVTPDSGTIELAGAPYVPDTPLLARQRGIAFIHQELNLFANLTVAENLFITGFPKRSKLWPMVDRAAMRKRAAELIAAVDLETTPDTPLANLSPGERQLVEIAKALSIDARIVIFDEPTTSLSVRETERLFALIERLREEGRAIVYISHALDDVMRLCDTIHILRDGAVVASGPTSTFTKASMVKAMVGRDLERLYPARKSAVQSENVLEVKGIRREGIVENIAFELKAGEVLGIAGLMGSGRSELARILFGIDPADAGTVSIAGKVLLNRSPAASIEHGMAFLTENRREEGLLMEFDVAQNVSLAALPRFAEGFSGVLSSEKLALSIKESALSVSIPESKLGRKMGDGLAVRTLSGGNQQKVVLAKWLLTKPKVFVLDEPTRGIDVGAKYEIYERIDVLAHSGAGVLVISSELDELIGICDRIMVMRHGEIVGSFGREQFDRERLLAFAFEGKQSQ
ncbi:MAG: sugar ABC transporter ATP-binding protein [Deltaproteobacteria bacterium]|nr:sugar ABC transporter ATP-binding protein [Deltaproteobacteria bacterium]